MQATIARVTVVLLLALMGVATVMIAPGDDRAVFSAQPEPPITVIALDTLEFEPVEVEVQPGQAVLVVNEGALMHDLVVDEWGLSTGPLDSGMTATFTVPLDAEPGTSVTFYCSVPGHQQAGQEGTFLVAATGQADSQPPNDAQETASVSAVDIAFDPEQIEVFPGQHVTVSNRGVAPHDLVVDEWEIRTAELAAGEHETITIPEEAEIGANVPYYCSVPGHREAGQEGVFVVVAPPEGADAAAAPTELEKLEATIAALEQRQADLAATATAIATEQAQIEERLVALEIQRNALIEATAAAQGTPGT